MNSLDSKNIKGITESQKLNFVKTDSKKYKDKTLINKRAKRINQKKVIDNNNILDLNNNTKNKINKYKCKNNKRTYISRKRKSSSPSNKKECDICHKLFDTSSFQIHYNTHPTKILDWLYLGTFTNARDAEDLKRNNITNIINVALECNNKKLPENINEFHIKIKDSFDFQIFNYFDKVNEYIEKCRKEGGNILVHCKYGVSRSPSFIIAYLIKYHKYSVDSALEFIKEKRSKINPNEGFLYQLYKYEEMINKK